MILPRCARIIYVGAALPANPNDQLTETYTVEKVKEMLGDIVKSCHERALEQQVAEGYIKLERGFATIPLPGIDVPFHSRYLWAGVMPFRACKLCHSRRMTIPDFKM